MSVDLEAGGALATAGLAAHEIESRTDLKPLDQGAHKVCANCKAELAGAFCSRCGQSAHVHRSLLHMFEEVLHGILHFDTKSWRTIPLLFVRPGLLTRRYIDGQRVRYVSPLALFLFCTFLMFFALSMLDSSKNAIGVNTNSDPEQARAEMMTEVEQAKKAVADRTAALSKATEKSEQSDLEEALNEAKADQTVAEATLATFDKARAVSSAIEKNGSVSKGIAEVAKEDSSIKMNIDTGSKRLDGVLNKARENPELIGYKLKNTAYKYSFMLIPISLPFLWLMFFWRRGVTLYDHAIFSLYSLSFMSLFVVTIALLAKLPRTAVLIGLLLLYPPVHMFLQLRETHSLGFGSTLWRTIALQFVAGTVFVLFLLMILAITLS